MKLKTDRSLSWEELVSGCAATVPPESPFSGTVLSDLLSNMQRTLRLRGLNQILKFFLCLKTELSGWA